MNQQQFEGLDIVDKMAIAERYTEQTGDNTNIANGLTKGAVRWLAGGRQKRAIEDAIEAFWASIAESYPEVKTGDFLPHSANLQKIECEKHLELWLELNAPSKPKLVGCHSPEATTKVLETLREKASHLTWEDSSYKNDAGDSLITSNEFYYLRVWLPNEESDNFAVTLDNNKSEHIGAKEFATIDKVIEALKNVSGLVLSLCLSEYQSPSEVD